MAYDAVQAMHIKTDIGGDAEKKFHRYPDCGRYDCRFSSGWLSSGHVGLFTSGNVDVQFGLPICIYPTKLV